MPAQHRGLARPGPWTVYADMVLFRVAPRIYISHTFSMSSDGNWHPTNPAGNRFQPVIFFQYDIILNSNSRLKITLLFSQTFE